MNLLPHQIFSQQNGNFRKRPLCWRVLSRLWNHLPCGCGCFVWSIILYIYIEIYGNERTNWIETGTLENLADIMFMVHKTENILFPDKISDKHSWVVFFISTYTGRALASASVSPPDKKYFSCKYSEFALIKICQMTYRDEYLCLFKWVF